MQKTEGRESRAAREAMDPEVVKGVAPRAAPQRVPPAIRLLRLGFRTAGRITPGLAAAFAFRLWFRTTPRREHPRESEVITRASERPIRFGDRRLATYSWGSGPGILLVHGWNGSGAQMTPLVEPLMGEGYRVVTFDAPAHGRTPGRRTDVFEIIEAIRTVVVEHGPFRGVVAHSMGVLSSALAMEAGALAASRAVCLAPAVTRDPVVTGFSRLLGLPPGVLTELERRVDALTGDAFWARAVIPVPALIVHDREDPEIPFTDGAGLVERWPAARLLATEGLGHRAVLREPEVIRRTIEFLESDSPLP